MKILYLLINLPIELINLARYLGHLEGQRFCHPYEPYDFSRDSALFPRRTRAVNDSGLPSGLISAINAAFDPKAEWSVLKYGVYQNRVGLQVFDKEAATAIVAAFNDKLNQLRDAFRGMPAYIGHPDDPEWAKANPGVRAEAVARIREMKALDDGLHFRTAYNDTGKRLVVGDAPAYDAYSPNWGMVPITYRGRKAFRPVELYSIGFTNQPNIPGTYIGLNEKLPEEPSDPKMKNHIIALLVAIGRPLANAAAVTDEQLATAVNEAVPVATKLVTDAGTLVTATNEKSTLQAQLTAAQGQVTAAVNEAATLRTALAAERAARAGLVITRAINEGRLTEAKRAEWLGKFTADKAEFAAVEGELNKLEKAINTASRTSDLGKRRGDPAASKTRINTINEAVMKYKKDNGVSDHIAAYNAVKAAQPDLFKEEAAS